MKKMIFLWSIFFGVAFTACPLRPKSENPVTSRTIWLNLVAEKRTENPESEKDTLVFDHKGDLTWTIAGNQYQYFFVQMYDNSNAIYQYSNGRYSGFSVDKENKLEIYSHSSKKIEDIDWSHAEWVFNSLHE